MWTKSDTVAWAQGLIEILAKQYLPVSAKQMTRFLAKINGCENETKLLVVVDALRRIEHESLLEEKKKAKADAQAERQAIKQQYPDSYIKNLLRLKGNVPDGLIEAKRAHLQLKREIKNQSKQK